MSKTQVQPEDDVQLLLASRVRLSFPEATFVQPEQLGHDSFMRVLRRLESAPEIPKRLVRQLIGMRAILEPVRSEGLPVHALRSPRFFSACMPGSPTRRDPPFGFSVVGGAVP